jgi:hypothetical protein
MKNNSKLNGIIVFAAIIIISSCSSVPSSIPTQTAKTLDLTGITSFYVSANGNDSNTGTSEDHAFSTLKKAVETASTTSLKIITVIGTLIGKTEIVDSGSDEILITGKANTSENEKAVLTATTNDEYTISIEGKSNIRFEYLVITDICIDGDSSRLTLGRDTVVSNNLAIDTEVYPKYGGGILVIGGTVVMLDNAKVTNSVAGAGGGVAVAEGATLIMQDNATISNNIARNDHFDNGGGGGVYCLGGKIILKDSAIVTRNSASHGGGILLRMSDIETADKLEIKGSGVYDSKQVSGNTATGTFLGRPGGDNIRVHNH